MRYDYFFKHAKEYGIDEAELFVTHTSSLSMSLFHSELDQFSMNHSVSVLARGKVNGKFGSASCDVWNTEKADYLLKEIARNAAVIENEDPQILFEGSTRYRKVNTYNRDLPCISIEEKKQKLYELESKIRAYDPRISEVGRVSYTEREGTTTLMNSKGLKLNRKTDYYYYSGYAVAKADGQTKTGGEIFLENDFSLFDVDALAKAIAERALAQLGGEACESGVYPVVLSPEVTADFLESYVSSADAEEVQRKSSLFMDMLGKRVASSKVTVEDRPLDKTLFARSFDDEGVATKNLPIIRGGILKNYLYNLTTAAKDGVQGTGNAARGVGKIGVSPSCLIMKPGTESREELFRSIGNGVYVTEVSGMHAGLNRQSGNFSLQSAGFLIENGKLGRPLDVITVSGNLKQLFLDVVKVGNDKRLFPSAISCPSVVVKKLNIAGK